MLSRVIYDLLMLIKHRGINIMKRLILLIMLTTLFILLFPIIASADIIYLNDGTEIRGDIIEVTNETITIKNDDGESIIDKANIIKIIFEDKEEQDTEYSKLRDTIKSKLEKLSSEYQKGIAYSDKKDIPQYSFSFCVGFSANTFYSKWHPEYPNEFSPGGFLGLLYTN